MLNIPWAKASPHFKISNTSDVTPSIWIHSEFSFEISEILSENDDEKDQNELKTLDIMDILWQNIVLEVPISYRKDPNKTYSLSGDGWELVDEERKKLDPRLAPLLELLEKEGKEWNHGSSF